MRAIITISLFTLLHFLGVAQVSITLNNTTDTVSGTTLYVPLNSSLSSPIVHHFRTTNNSGSDQQFRITREKFAVPFSWQDAVVWVFGFDCSGVQSFTTPSSVANPAPTIIDGTSICTDSTLAEFQSLVYPNWNDLSNAKFNYYVTDMNGNYVDSVKIHFTTSLGLDALQSDFEISPNPTSEILRVNTEINSGHIFLQDINGAVLMEIPLENSNGILDVAHLSNGIYFAVLIENKIDIARKKVLIQH